MKMPLAFTLNGHATTTDIEPYWTLQRLLRDELDLTGTKEGCRTGNCGVCTVMVDGNAVKSCLIRAAQLQGTTVTTMERPATDQGRGPGQGRYGEYGGLRAGHAYPGCS